MSTRRRSIATAGLLAIAAFSLYAVRIGSSPLSPAETELLQPASTVGVGAYNAVAAIVTAATSSSVARRI